MIRKLLQWGGLAFVVFFLAYRPEAAADVLHAVGGALRAMWSGFREWGDSVTG